MLMYYVSDENTLYVCWYSFISHIFISLWNHVLLECPNIPSLSSLLCCDILEFIMWAILCNSSVNSLPSLTCGNYLFYKWWLPQRDFAPQRNLHSSEGGSVFMIPFSSQAKSTLFQGSLQSVSEHGRCITAWSCLLIIDYSDFAHAKLLQSWLTS